MSTRLAPSALALAALAAVAQGCSPVDSIPLVSTFVCAPAQDASTCAPSGGKCERFLTGDSAWMFLQVATTSGNVDNGLYFYVQVNNDRPDNSDENTGQLNTAYAVINQYVLSFDAPGYSIPDYTSNAIQVTVPAAGSLTPFVNFIPVEVSPALQALLPVGEATLVVVNAKLKGHYGDGKAFETDRLQLPTYVYNDVFGGYACPKLGDEVTAICPNAGQTATITCEAP
jgi:hypothetical protein